MMNPHLGRQYQAVCNFTDFGFDIKRSNVTGQQLACARVTELEILSAEKHLLANQEFHVGTVGIGIKLLTFLSSGQGLAGSFAAVVHQLNKVLDGGYFMLKLALTSNHGSCSPVCVLSEGREERASVVKYKTKGCLD